MGRRDGTGGDAGGHRHRLTAGMAAAVTEKGYRATTIADVVRRAQVSKRTFYQHFADKQECFLASFADASEHLLRVVQAAGWRPLPWRERVSAAVTAYLAALDAHPAMTRGLTLELSAAGPRALALRREQLQRFADLLHDLLAEAAKEDRDLRVPAPAMCMALVGGINELVLLAIEEDAPGRLTDLAGTGTELIAAVLTAPPMA
ncbi:TetR/AcrR family transcriptional regulator [Rhizomonospora bruguierae]|uniref:TetR/AcrR family transcriptional regulator n=1 Tax=Rhizomonospora bruguierae TaxID=1581705 RepID=UPI001BCA91B8|nr:TetR/AcrR family transcriptional regulator [Micromonospora sp. NBRC 107566]